MKSVQHSSLIRKVIMFHAFLWKDLLREWYLDMINYDRVLSKSIEHRFVCMEYIYCMFSCARVAQTTSIILH